MHLEAWQTWNTKMEWRSPLTTLTVLIHHSSHHSSHAVPGIQADVITIDCFKRNERRFEWSEWIDLLAKAELLNTHVWTEAGSLPANRLLSVAVKMKIWQFELWILRMALDNEDWRFTSAFPTSLVSHMLYNRWNMEIEIYFRICGLTPSLNLKRQILTILLME